jgi:hypothetical protein
MKMSLNPSWTKEDFWLSHLRHWNNVKLFPREYGLYRTKVYKKDYTYLLSTQYRSMDCYTSVYSEGQLEDGTNGVYDTLFLEARESAQGEKVNLNDVIADRDMLRAIFEKNGIGERDLFSGGRSYHFYTDFPPMPVLNLSAMARNFVYELDIVDLLDMHTVGNRRSMARIPYTYSPKHEQYAVYSDADDADVLRDDAKYGRITMPPVTDLKETSILKYLNANDADYRFELLKPANIAFDGTYPDCVLNILGKLAMESHATHDERIHLTAYLYRFGHSISDIVNTFRDASDFNPVITESQVMSLVSKDYRPFGCRRVKAEMLNVCPFARTKSYCHYISSSIEKKKKLGAGTVV